MACEQTLADCLDDQALLAQCTTEELRKIRAIAMVRLRDALCACQASPVEVDGVRFPTPAELIRELRLLLLNIQSLIDSVAEQQGPVMMTLWKDRCGIEPGYGCVQCVPSDCDDVSAPRDSCDGPYHLHGCETAEDEC